MINSLIFSEVGVWTISTLNDVMRKMFCFRRIRSLYLNRTVVHEPLYTSQTYLEQLLGVEFEVKLILTSIATPLHEMFARCCGYSSVNPHHISTYQNEVISRGCFTFVWLPTKKRPLNLRSTVELLISLWAWKLYLSATGFHSRSIFIANFHCKLSTNRWWYGNESTTSTVYTIGTDFTVDLCLASSGFLQVLLVNFIETSLFPKTSHLSP